jgi:hypothetical protein
MGNRLLPVSHVFHRQKNTLTESTLGIQNMLGTKGRILEIWYIASGLPQGNVESLTENPVSKTTQADSEQTP